MRAIFGAVLLAGVAAAIGLSAAMRTGDEVADAPPIKSEDPPEAPAVSPDPAPRAPDPVAVRIEDLLRKNDAPGAARVLGSLVPADFANQLVRDRALDTADALMATANASQDASATGLRLDARKIYSTVYLADAASESDVRRAFDACTKLNQTLLFGNGAPESLVLRHKVQPGESVWALAKGAWRQRGVTAPAGFVLHANGVQDAKRLRAGQTLRVPLERLSVLVRKSRFELTLLLGGAPVERFPVAIGADASTPAGTFKVKDRIKNPDWYFRGRKIPFGDPQNIIGTRWIGLGGAAAIEGIGIHGTTDDASVGKAASMGCVRMHNADVERLFEWLDAGVDVEIRD